MYNYHVKLCMPKCFDSIGTSERAKPIIITRHYTYLVAKIDNFERFKNDKPHRNTL